MRYLIALLLAGAVLAADPPTVNVNLPAGAQIIFLGVEAGNYAPTVGAFSCGAKSANDADNSVYCSPSVPTNGPLKLNGALIPPPPSLPTTGRNPKPGGIVTSGKVVSK